MPCNHGKDSYRLPRSGRSNSGLGQALVEALARIMGLKVNLRLDDQRDFLVTVSGLSAA